MKKILVLNLTRIGDLIQTTPLMEGLKRSDPDCEITLLGNVKFIGICEHLPFIDRLKVFDVMQFINSGGEPTSYLAVYRYMDGLVRELRAEKFDMLINLTHSKLSALIGGQLGIKEVRGASSTSDGFKVVNDPWLVYFSAFTGFRRYNSFNLVDIYQLGGGVKPGSQRLRINARNGSSAVAPLLKELGVEEGDTVIGIAAGASLKERRWPAEKFAAAADLISERHGAKVLLFGGPSEEKLVGKVESHMKRPVMNLAGKTSLEELIGLVKRCSLLVTNDTGTMHVASAVGTPVVALFFVHAFGAETGPYGEGHIVIEPEISCFPCPHKTACPHYACFDRVSPHDVADAADIIYGTDTANGGNAGGDRFQSARPFITCFDELGFFDLRPIKKEPLREEVVFNRIYRYLFLKIAYPELEPSYFIDYLKDNFEQWEAEKTGSWVEKKRSAFHELASTAGEAIKTVDKMSRDYKNGKVAMVKRGAGKLVEFDKKTVMLAYANEEQMPIAGLFNRGKGNITEMPLEIMLAKTKLLYTGVRDSARFVRRMLGVWGGTEDAVHSRSELVDCNDRTR